MYDPIYGARPLRRAIMKYLEDTLAEQCLSKTLYPNTKIHVSRKKVEGTLMTYTNDIEVKVDFSDIDPNLLNGDMENGESSTEITNSETIVSDDNSSDSPDLDNNDLNLDDDELTPVAAGKGTRFFKKKG